MPPEFVRENETKELFTVTSTVMHEDGTYSYALRDAKNCEMFSSGKGFRRDFTRLELVYLRHVAIRFGLLFDPRFRPSKATPKSLGIDVRATIGVTLLPGQRAKIPTGVSWVSVQGVPPGFIAEMQVRARSGLANKHGIAMTNGIGTVDQDYRGEICALIINLGNETVEIKAGDKIAQVIPTVHPDMEGTDVFLENKEERGAQGFGSSGV
jgi:dUTP pyrophosphatase